MRFFIVSHVIQAGGGKLHRKWPNWLFIDYYSLRRDLNDSNSFRKRPETIGCL
jgi:hypothetical protein